ncbi:pleckstrin homology domain-containing family G member 3 isoform X3 [Pygocentrus nattereri]|uniref:pleckstrin homology domain-containing family G member 3 isoform X3 n=1 Tax=Pygocentrus nattereri TaxID=42514 RepID=UPI001890FA28|nr:pleckstrin homology domain-containing family G member 3 isoform X3 [Pygocentrus nattereri]
MPEESHSSHCHRHRHHHHQHQDSMGDESPRLSVDSSLSSHDPTLAEYCSLLGVEHSEDERPVSAVSTLSSTSSGEGQSSPFRGPILASSRPSPPTGPDIDLELSPPEEREEPSTLLKPGSRRPKQDPSEDQCNHNVSSTGARTPPQNSDTPSPIATEAMAPNPQLTYVDRVVMEIIETERMYVQDLCSIVEDYLAYIIDARDLPIKPEQVSSLFGNIEVIYEFNSELLQCLEMCHSDPVAIACCFVDKSQYFNIYTQYCTNYPNSVATLTECMRNKTLAKFFRDRQASLERSLPLGAYLLKPVQRILKYHLLLQEIVKHFDPEEDGYDVVEEAIDTMTGVAWYINDMKRKHEHAVRLQEIQSLLLNWKGPDLTTYGELVLEGTFHVHRAKNERTLFLFDKMLLITKKRGEHYVYKTHITCSTLMLIESAKDSLRFSVTHYKHPKQPHTVQAKTVEEKKLWAHHIKRLILENHHAIIPQKAKDAILDMSSSGPVKYRYSPERLKKPLSFQNEDFPAGGRKGRRRSEPMKQSVKNTKGTLKYGDEEEPSEENELGTKRSQTPSEDEQDLGLCEQDSSGDYCSQSFSLAEGTEESRGQQPPLHPEMSQDVDMECEETVESSMDSSSPIHNESQLEDKGPPSSRNLTEDVEDLEEEDDEEEEEDVLLGTEPTSILPTSVLDKASDIAERFISSLSRRSSLVVDDMYSIGCHSSCTGSRRSSLLGLNADLLEKEKIHELNCYSPELHAVIPMAEPSASSTVTDRLATPDQRPPNKQDTLSKKDRMLIHKIKQYYEHAEHQDANFSIKRRESLSYIPAGLVRNLSRQINGLPTDEDIAVYKKVSSASRPTSWAVFNLPGLDKERNTMAKHTNLPATVDGNDAMVRSPVGGENEDFQPSAEMLRVWKDMEVEVVEGSESHQDTGKDGLYDVRPNQKQKRRESSDDECGEPLLILEESDNSMAGQGSLTPSPVSNHTWKDPELELRPNSENMLQERHRVRHAPLPKIISLRSGSEEDLILQDMEKMKNKVFQLARQYSQRIKNSRPVVKQRARVPESHFGPTNLASLVEDKSPVHEKGLRSIILPHGSCEHTEHSPSHSPSSLDSPRLQSPSRAPSLSPQSPVYTENFHWPAVRELRSKYSRRGTQPLSVTRSCSVPDRILETALSDHKAQRSCSCSTPVYGSSTPTKATAASCYESQGPAGQTATKLCKANSVDYMMAPLNLNYISGEDTQPNDNKVIIVERIIGEQSGESGFAGEEKKEETGENHLRWDPDLELPARIKDRNHDSRLQTWLDGSRTYPLRSLGKTETSQHSLVKNLREKFQNLSSHT